MGCRRMCRFLIVANLFVAGLCATASAQELQRWRHGLIEPKGDGGFSLMVAYHDFAEKHGLKIETFILKNGATAIKPLLAGEVDIAAPPRYGAIVAERIPGARLEVLAGEAHQPFQERPEAWNARVNAFWREVEARR